MESYKTEMECVFIKILNWSFIGSNWAVSVFFSSTRIEVEKLDRK